MNPSPGHIKDGLMTHAMKSFGAVRKGGTLPVAYVLDYTEMAVNPGLNFSLHPVTMLNQQRVILPQGLL